MGVKIVSLDSVKSIADMLRYFVGQRRFGYIDQVRAARTLKEFERHLMTALREARALKEAAKKGTPEWYIHVPTVDEIEDAIKLVGDAEKLEEVKTVISLYAFSYRRGKKVE